MDPFSRELPAEVYDIIAWYLFLDDAMKTCASLNAVSRTAYEGTLAALHHTIRWTRPLEYAQGCADVLPRGKRSEKVFSRGISRYQRHAVRWVRKCFKFPGARHIKYIMIPDQTNLLRTEISGVLLSLPNVKAITQVGCYESPRKPTAIHLGSGFQYGTADWQHAVFEFKSECSTVCESLAAGNVKSVDSTLPLLDRPLKNCDINIRCVDLREYSADRMQSLIGDVVTTLYHATRQNNFGYHSSMGNFPARVRLSCPSMDDVRDLTTTIATAIQCNPYYASMEVIIRCREEVSVQKVEAAMLSLFTCILPHLAELDPDDFGTISVECLSSEKTVGVIEVREDDGDGLVQLQLFMMEGDGFRLVKSQPYPFLDEDEEDDSSVDSSADLGNNHPRDSSLGAERTLPDDSGILEDYRRRTESGFDFRELHPTMPLPELPRLPTLPPLPSIQHSVLPRRSSALPLSHVPASQAQPTLRLQHPPVLPRDLFNAGRMSSLRHLQSAQRLTDSLSVVAEHDHRTFATETRRG